MSGIDHLRDLKAGDVIVVGTGKRATTATIDSVGRNYLYAGTGVYRRDNGRQKTGNGIARTVLGWRTEMQAAAARSALSAVSSRSEAELAALAAACAFASAT